MKGSFRPLKLGRSRLLFFLACLFFVSAACEITFDFELPGEPVVRTEHSGAWYEIYFTNPSCPTEFERTAGIDEIIANDLLAAERTVDIAAFDLDAQPIVNALIELEKRGVVVRVVTDEENEDLSSIRRLRANGTSVVTDDRSALMHNKFIVIDGRYVWMGSMNYTSNGAYCNNNNAVRFDSPELAANYEAEMDEMYIERSFGPTSPADTPYPQLEINEVLLETYFASEEKLAPVIAELVGSAQDEVLFMAFSFTHQDIGQALLERAAAGVEVRGVFETVGSETSFSYYPTLHDTPLANLEVRQDGNPRIMHHKVFIIDREIVVFGSFNFSGNANDSNDENVIIVHDPEFSDYFVEEFETVWEEAGP
jgi:phosphatidylserine/phosphatidylglycerophosphate/cardiolipin synthase-like enzyme